MLFTSIHHRREMQKNNIEGDDDHHHHYQRLRIHTISGKVNEIKAVGI